jgi:hypothetical protein
MFKKTASRSIGTGGIAPVIIVSALVTLSLSGCGNSPPKNSSTPKAKVTVSSTPTIALTPTPIATEIQSQSSVKPTAHPSARQTKIGSTPSVYASPTSQTFRFGVAIPWESTPPEKLALPWTTIPPAATTSTIAIVKLDQHSILIAAERGSTRTAFVVNGISGFRIQKREESQFGDLVLVTCLNGEEAGVGYFAADRTWNAMQHPSSFTLFPLGEPDNSCLK